MSRSDSSPPSPSPQRRPLNIRLILGALAVMTGLLIIALANQSSERPTPEPKNEPAAQAKSASMVPGQEPAFTALIIRAELEAAQDFLARGQLLDAYELQQQAALRAANSAKQWPNDAGLRGLVRQAGELVYQFEKYGAALPTTSGQTGSGPKRYPDEAGLPGVDDQINDLFVSGWASEQRDQPEVAIGIYNQGLDRLDQLLRSGDEPAPAPTAEVSSDQVPLPPPAADRSAETRYLKKYYAFTSRLAALETGAGRAEAVRRRALAAIDRGLTRGVEAADLSAALDSILDDLAQRERLSGRLESARLTLQRRLGLKQYLLIHPPTDPASTSADSPPPPPDTSLDSAQSPPSAIEAEAGAAGQTAAAPDRFTAKILVELAWLDRHTFHYDEGLEYLAELLDAAERAGQAAFTETDRLARLSQGQMLMDLGRFQEAELALQNARPYLNRLVDGPQPALMGRVDVEPRVTSIRANLALSELALAQADLPGADRYMEEAVSLYRTLPGGHPVTFDVQLIRVKVLARKGDSQRAERELTAFLADSSQLLASPEVDIWVKRQILALMAEAAWQAQARGESDLAVDHYKRVNDELTPYITGIDVDNSSQYGSLFRPILVEIMEGEGDLRADRRQLSQAESRYVLGLDMARALRDQEPRQYFWRTRFNSLAGKVERFHY